MAAYKTFSKREVQKILKANGFIYAGSNRGIDKYKRDGEILVLNTEPNKVIFNRLIKEYKLEVQL